MKFQFEGTVKEFNSATMEEVLLRQMQNRAGDRRIVYGGCGVLLAIGLSNFFNSDIENPLKRLAVLAAVCAALILIQRRTERTGGTAQDSIKRIKVALDAQTEEESQRVFTYTFSEDSCTIASGEEVVGSWDCARLCRVSESEHVIALWRKDGKIRKSVLPVPKDCLKDASMEDFHEYLREHLDAKGKMEFFKIPETLKKLL